MGGLLIALVCFLAGGAALGYAAWFFTGPIDTRPGGHVAIDVALVAMFGVQHSVMARASFKRAWTRVVPPHLERSAYVLASGLALGVVMWQWRSVPRELWHVSGEVPRAILWGVYWAGWGLLLVAAATIDALDLFGLRPPLDRWRGRAPAPLPFKTPGLYRIVRHPIYFSFLVVAWVTPAMTVGHALFSGAFTVYMLIGMTLEERDLVRHFGDDYRAYRRRVAALIPFVRLPGR